jgi:SAM-dependent methyltransferase
MFKTRSNKKELLDDVIIDHNELYLNLEELETINKYLGGHATSIHGLRKLFSKFPIIHKVVDVGCGGGDSIRAISDFYKDKKSVKYEGIDFKPDCIQYSKEKSHLDSTISFQVDDFWNYNAKSAEVTVFHFSLFMHHFSNDEIIAFIKKLHNDNQAIVINDLVRSPMAYYGILFLTKLFSNSRLVKNDAPLSVLRGFKRAEWRSLLHEAEITNYEILSRPMFRHLIIVYPN